MNSQASDSAWLAFQCGKPGNKMREVMLTTELIHALPSSERRVFNRTEAASYVGLSSGYFGKLVDAGTMPKSLPLPGVRRWDKAALDQALDVWSGLDPAKPTSPVSPYDEWSNRRGQS